MIQLNPCLGQLAVKHIRPRKLGNVALILCMINTKMNAEVCMITAKIQAVINVVLLHFTPIHLTPYHLTPIYSPLYHLTPLSFHPLSFHPAN